LGEGISTFQSVKNHLVPCCLRGWHKKQSYNALERKNFSEHAYKQETKGLIRKEIIFT
jgi:hypothetical protein